ncbi:MAG: DUF5060 domain-containing protein [Rikenellaceae bacterium]
MRRIIFLLLLALNVGVAHSAIQRQPLSRTAIEAERFEVVDITLQARGKITNPFIVEATAIFTSPSGATQNVPIFYNGGSEWVIRFSASESGAWSFKTQSDIKALSGRSGKVNISKESYNNRRGAIIRKADKPRHLYWQDGSPYFMVGFECDFLFTLDYHNKVATPKLDGFLDGVSRYGFNHMVMNVYANDVVWVKDPKLKERPQYEVGGDETIFPFLGSNTKPDYSSLNVDFFKHFDRTMEALNDRDIISHLMIYVWNKNVAWPKYGEADDNIYFDYVIKRYQAFSNLVWDISKEAILYGNVGDDYIKERIERVKRLDSYKRLVTVHDFGFCVRNKSSVDFMSHQNWRGSIYDDMLKGYNKNSDKPTFNIEHGGYEECDFEVFCGNYTNAEYCLRRNWLCVFAGSYSTYYWQGCSWNVLIYDWDKQPATSYLPKMIYFKHMVDFFTKYQYDEFRPIPELNNSGYVMTNDKDTYLFYMPKESYKTSMGKVMKGAKKISFQWFNTTTGEYSKESTTTQMDIFANVPHPWHMKSDAVLITKIVEKK